MTSRRWPFTCRISISYFVIIGVDTIIIIVFMCNPAKLANCHKRKCSVCVCVCVCVVCQSCQWAGEKCDSAYIQKHYTGVGTCYTVNWNPSDVLYAKQAGRQLRV